VGNEFITGAAHLVGVAIAGEIEGPLERGAIDRRNRKGRGVTVAIAVFGLWIGRVELLHHGEEIGEQLLVL
jgi:threonine/homoserine efflux transporter RhtA